MTTVQSPENLDTELQRVLTAEALSALMRSTWTWDDRALRRDLAGLLVDIAAARACNETAIAKVLLARTLRDGARFSATVLGPRLIADTGNPLRPYYVAAASNPAALGRLAAAARHEAAPDIAGYLSGLTGIDYQPEGAWRQLVESSGVEGLAAAMRAYGHGLSESSFFAIFGLAWQILTAVNNSPQANDLANQLVNGSTTATLAAAEESGSWDPVMVKTVATPTADGWLLNGLKHFVLHADTADVILVVGRSVAGPSVFAVSRSAPGLTVTPLPIMDSTRPLYAVSLTDTPATLLGREGSGGRFMVEALGRAITALAGEQVGIIELAIEKLSASGASAADVTESALHHAKAVGMWRTAVHAPTLENAAMAHIAASSAAVAVAQQLAEAIGPDTVADTIQHRAMSAELLFGGPALSHERLLEHLGI